MSESESLEWVLMISVLTSFPGDYNARWTLRASALHRPASSPSQAAPKLLLALLASWPTLWSLPRTLGLLPRTWPPEKFFPTLALILNMALSMKLLYSLTHSCLHVSSR